MSDEQLTNHVPERLAPDLVRERREGVRPHSRTLDKRRDHRVPRQRCPPEHTRMSTAGFSA